MTRVAKVHSSGGWTYIRLPVEPGDPRGDDYVDNMDVTGMDPEEQGFYLREERIDRVTCDMPCERLDLTVDEYVALLKRRGD